MNAYPLFKTSLALGAAALGAAFSSGQAADLGDPVRIGTGRDASVTVADDGTVYAVYAEKIRSGPSLDKLGPEEELGITPGLLMNPKVEIQPGTSIPHVVYQVGRTQGVRSIWYVTKSDGQWSEPLKLADAEELDVLRTAYARVAVDSKGNVLASWWGFSGCCDRSESVQYRWRDPQGNWGPVQKMVAHWSSTPRVRQFQDKFYLMWQNNNDTWKVSGPVEAGSAFTTEGAVALGSEALGMRSQNEGGNFNIGPNGAFAAAGNIRTGSGDDPIGIWASVVTDGKAEAAFLGPFAETNHHDQSAMHPEIVFDAETGMVVVVTHVQDTNKAYYATYLNGEWSDYSRLYPEGDGQQSMTRSGPGLADLPGPGVLAIVRNETDIYLRTIGAAGIER